MTEWVTIGLVLVAVISLFRKRRGTLVLGTQVAAGRRADEEHRRQHPGKPVLSTAYDFFRGEKSLVDPSPAALDDEIQAMTRAYASADADRRSAMRDALSMDEFYELSTFAMRQAVFALRDRDHRRIIDGATAVAMLDPSRMDWRDTTWDLNRVYYAGLRIGADIDGIVRAAAALAGVDQQKTMTAFAGGALVYRRRIESFALAETRTSHGIGLVSRSSERWKPAGDMTALATAIGELINADRYQLDDVTIATKSYPVWFNAAEKDVSRLLKRARAVAHISGKLRPADDVLNERGLGIMLWVMELDNEQTAKALYTIGPSRSASIVIQERALFCIVIHNAIISGGEPAETAATLERFRDPIKQLFSAYQ